MRKPSYPGGFSRFTNATDPNDTSVDFFGATGTLAGEGSAPCRYAEEAFDVGESTYDPDGVNFHGASASGS